MVGVLFALTMKLRGTAHLPLEVLSGKGEWGGAGMRMISPASFEARKAEFSIAQYEFSPVCGMQKQSICIFIKFCYQS